MKRTISIKLETSPEQDRRLVLLQQEFARACNALVPFAVSNSCKNRVNLHHLGYYSVRGSVPDLGSQMVCNTVAAVAQSYKSLLANNPKFKNTVWPLINFRDAGSVHFDKRTYSIKGNAISLYTTEGRIIVPMKPGEFQKQFLNTGNPKEAVSY